MKTKNYHKATSLLTAVTSLILSACIFFAACTFGNPEIDRKIIGRIDENGHVFVRIDEEERDIGNIPAEFIKEDADITTLWLGDDGHVFIEYEDGTTADTGAVEDYVSRYEIAKAQRKPGYSFRPLISEVMPTVHIDTDDGKNDFATKYTSNNKTQIQYVGATVTINNCEKEYELSYAAEVKARGNGSLNYAKKGIRIKFDKKQNMLGLNEGRKFKSWVLLAEWNDLSMSNNATAFFLAKNILGSDGYYSTDFRHVELYINGEYWGVYLLCEQQEAKSEDGRMSVPEVPKNYTGNDIGYFFEYDAYAKDEQRAEDGNPIFEMTYNNRAALTKINGQTYQFRGGGFTTATQFSYTVKSDIYADSQVQFLKSYMDNAYKIAYEAAYNNKFYKFNDTYTGIVSTTGTPKEIVSSVIDLPSLVDMYILHEIAVDSDIAWSSFNLSVDLSANGSKKIIFEAPWDFDLSFGIRKGYEQSGGTGWYAGVCNNPWLILLVSKDWFQDMVRAKWAEIMEHGVFKTALSLIEEYKTTYAEYYVKNYVKWKERITNGGQSGQIVEAVNKNKTQADGAAYLTNWLIARLNWLNSQWGNGESVLAELR